MSKKHKKKDEVKQLFALGKSGVKFTKLETFKAPPNCFKVELVSQEVTAVCPVTGQPDFYKVDISYCPLQVCVESKTVKLYLQSFREKGLFCEAFAHQIAHDFATALGGARTQVTVTQVPRGGVAIVAHAVEGGL